MRQRARLVDIEEDLITAAKHYTAQAGVEAKRQALPFTQID